MHNQSRQSEFGDVTWIARFICHGHGTTSIWWCEGNMLRYAEITSCWCQYEAPLTREVWIARTGSLYQVPRGNPLPKLPVMNQSLTACHPERAEPCSTKHFTIPAPVPAVKPYLDSRSQLNSLNAQMIIDSAYHLFIRPCILSHISTSTTCLHEPTLTNTNIIRY